MGYRVPKFRKSDLTSVETFEGETIEQKIERIVANKEPIKDGAPEIFTERKDGVISAYNIRADRWEIAADAMDAVSKSIEAKRDGKAKMEVIKEDDSKEKVDKVAKDNSQDSGAKSVQGGEKAE